MREGFGEELMRDKLVPGTDCTSQALPHTVHLTVLDRRYCCRRRVYSEKSLMNLSIDTPLVQEGAEF